MEPDSTTIGATPSTVGGVSGCSVPLTMMVTLHTSKNENTAHSTAPATVRATLPAFFFMRIPLFHFAKKQ